MNEHSLLPIPFVAPLPDAELNATIVGFESHVCTASSHSSGTTAIFITWYCATQVLLTERSVFVLAWRETIVSVFHTDKVRYLGTVPARMFLPSRASGSTLKDLRGFSKPLDMSVRPSHFEVY
jgi:hypothetical protein